MKHPAAIATLVLCGLVSCTPSNKTASFRLNTEVPGGDAGFSDALYQLVGVTMKPGHTLEILDNGAVFDGMVEDIAAAKESIHIVMYIWDVGGASDRLIGAIEERAKSGVACRILVDDVGSAGFMENVAEPLVKAGCAVRVFRPLDGTGWEHLRNHRKIVVIDSRVAFTGGLGIRDVWLGDGLKKDEWRDTNVRFTGPAVSDAQQAIAENWIEAGGSFFPGFPSETPPVGGGAGTAQAAFVSSTGSLSTTDADRLMHLLMAAADKRLWISNAYFMPSDPLLELLITKAKAGVDVRLLTAGKKSDSKMSFGSQQFNYGELVESGVKVWEYEPTMMHAKSVIVDDHLGAIGSINLEPLSLNHLEEGALVFEDPPTVAEMAATFVEDCSHGKAKHD